MSGQSYYTQIRRSGEYPPNRLDDSLENTKILLQRLICSFGLTVGLWVVAGGEVASDLEHFKKVLPEF